MRKLSTGNKTRFTIFTIIIIGIVIVLLIFLSKALQFEKEIYTISKEVALYDKDYEYVSLTSDAIIEKKWTGKYYLTEPETIQSYDLGTSVVAFDTIKNRLNLYGTFFEVGLDGEVSKRTKNTEISDLLNSKLYKIEDRKYLIVAQDISNTTQTIVTENYLIIIIDKSGNTLLLNNKMNIKTINALVLETDLFQFDVANEKLLVGDEKIDLKKIIGSTNQYVEPVKKVETENTEQGNQNNSGRFATSSTSTSVTIGSPTTAIINSNTGATNTGTSITSPTTSTPVTKPTSSNSNVTNNNEEKSNQRAISNVKSVNLRSVNPGETYIDVQYSVIDPENEYQVVYILITGDNMNKMIALDKSKDFYKITDLTQNTDYTLTLGYKLIKSDSTIEEVQEDIINVKTQKLQGILKITKVTENKIYFNLKLDKNSSYDNAKVSITINGNKLKKQISVDTGHAIQTNGWTSSIEKTEEMIGKLTLTLEGVEDLKLTTSAQIY